MNGHEQYYGPRTPGFRPGTLSKQTGTAFKEVGTTSNGHEHKVI